MHFNTLISTLLSASIAVTGVAASDIAERATKNTASDVATFKSIVSDSTTFCAYWQAEYRSRTPFKELTAGQINNVCNNILPAVSITTCIKTDLAKVKAGVTEPQNFCNFYSAQSPRLVSPFTNINATALMAVCKYCLPSTSSTLSPAVKATSTSAIAKSSSKSTSKSSSKSSSFSTSLKSSAKSSSASIVSSSVTRSAYTSSASSISSSKSSSSRTSAVSSAVAAAYTGQGNLYAVLSNTTADGTALQGFTSGATDVGFGLTNSGYATLPYSLDSAGHLYLGSSGVLLSGLKTATSAAKLGALANGTTSWTPVTCSIDNGTSELSCSYTNQYKTVMNTFQLYTGSSNGATAYYLQLAPSGSTTGVTVKALKSYTASASSTAAAVTATGTDQGSAASAVVTEAPVATTSSATSTSTTTTPDFATLTCDTAPTGAFNIYASNSSSYAGAVGKPLRNSYSNYAAFYLTDTDTYPPLEFTYDPSTAYIASNSNDDYLVAATGALVETGVAVLPLSTGATYTPIQCGIAVDCTMKCNYTTAYYMNYTVAQIFNVLDLQFNTDNTDDFYTLEMNQYGLPIGVVLTVVPVEDQ